MSDLTEKIKEYQKAIDAASELDNQLKEVKKIKADLEAEICKIMIDEEIPSIAIDGFNYSLQQKNEYSKKSEEDLYAAGIVFLDVLRDEGLGDLIKEVVDARTLSSTIRSMVEETGEIPLGLQDCINVYERLSISRRKANTKALERAKANN